MQFLTLLGFVLGKIISMHGEIAYFPIMAFRLNSTLSNISSGTDSR